MEHQCTGKCVEQIKFDRLTDDLKKILDITNRIIKTTNTKRISRSSALNSNSECSFQIQEEGNFPQYFMESEEDEKVDQDHNQQH